MDNQILHLIAIIPFILFLFVALKIGRSLKKTDSTPKIPPGPWKLPIIGNIPHLVTSTPHRKLKNLAKIYGPLMHLQLGEIFTIVVSSPEYAREVMKTHDVIFASRPHILATEILSYESTNIGFSPYGNYWRHLRKICTMELFTQKRVSSFQPIREEELTNLVKRIDSQKGSPINLTQAVTSSIYTINSRAAFGKKCKDQEEFISAAKEAITVAGGFDIGDLFPSAKWLQQITGLRPKLERLHRKVDQIMENIITEHKEEKSKPKEGRDEAEEDLIDVLLKFQDGNGSNQDICLTNNNIKAITLDIFVAGGETAATTIDWAMAEMVKNPRVMKKVQHEVREVFNMKGMIDEICINELKYLKSVVKETLRLHSPVPLLLPRECGQACEIHGYHIPAKSKVVVNAWAIGRDPKCWTEPERFYPERFINSSVDYKGSNFEYIPFGAGRRICPGSTLGLINVELTLALLLYHFDWKIPNRMNSEDLDMTEQFGVTVRRKYNLYLIPIPFKLGPSLVIVTTVG
ncbi:cytochrome P450 71D11-like [Gastrolobium bilobum]|uniref:cytochrome P450 71D11-like n=1 Tax=Gastrolobium bilobum TaxID=150636 RepID=UPI002AB0FF6E|nr:cytochrome P450 71D11-like [Gastrolobium bilobum]